ncbi:dihydrodipicolinate synthase family protein [Halovivax gelatinilyticus]|uniref:dihydrodipicolinate synthase family protein n=1 Tax=Halovivax gelatinilyticus TaxID=2961597 RepID=UPI0020CA81F1|nr:dihydrodipicolinate synthase family protein [Halovivax gelatinilyticus]
MNGMGVPIVTPFDGDDRVDHVGLRTLVTWLESTGVDFLVPCGSTGEAPLLSANERRRVVETVADAATVPVLAGTGREGFEPALAATEAADAAGADAALVLTPSYYDPDQSTLASYYRDLADESPIPLYLYSVPVYTDVVLDPETVATLADHDAIAGIKDSSGNVARLQRAVRLTADASFDVLVGNGAVPASGLDVGVDGAILALAHVVPELAVELARCHADGDVHAAASIQADLAPLNRAMVGAYGAPGVKAGLELRGQPGGEPRRPLRPVDDAARETIRSHLERLDVV